MFATSGTQRTLAADRSAALEATVDRGFHSMVHTIRSTHDRSIIGCSRDRLRGGGLGSRLSGAGRFDDEAVTATTLGRLSARRRRQLILLSAVRAMDGDLPAGRCHE